MAFEGSIKTFKKDKQRLVGVRGGRYLYSKTEAYNLVIDKLSDRITEENIVLIKGNGDKEHFRKIKDQYKSIVTDIIFAEQITVRDYQENVGGFVDFVVEEIVGYSEIGRA